MNKGVKALIVIASIIAVIVGGYFLSRVIIRNNAKGAAESEQERVLSMAYTLTNEDGITYEDETAMLVGDFQNMLENPTEDMLNSWKDAKSDIKGWSVYDKYEYGLYTHDGSDTDGDKLSDKEEIEKYKSDPLKYSTAGDEYPDGYKIAHKMDVNKAYEFDGDAFDWDKEYLPKSTVSVSTDSYEHTKYRNIIQTSGKSITDEFINKNAWVNKYKQVYTMFRFYDFCGEISFDLSDVFKEYGITADDVDVVRVYYGEYGDSYKYGDVGDNADVKAIDYTIKKKILSLPFTNYAEDKFMAVAVVSKEKKNVFEMLADDITVTYNMNAAKDTVVNDIKLTKVSDIYPDGEALMTIRNSVNVASYQGELPTIYYVSTGNKVKDEKMLEDMKACIKAKIVREFNWNYKWYGKFYDDYYMALNSIDAVEGEEIADTAMQEMIAKYTGDPWYTYGVQHRVNLVWGPVELIWNGIVKGRAFSYSDVMANEALAQAEGESVLGKGDPDIDKGLQEEIAKKEEERKKEIEEFNNRTCTRTKNADGSTTVIAVKNGKDFCEDDIFSFENFSSAYTDGHCAGMAEFVARKFNNLDTPFKGEIEEIEVSTALPYNYTYDSNIFVKLPDLKNEYYGATVNNVKWDISSFKKLDSVSKYGESDWYKSRTIYDCRLNYIYQNPHVITDDEIKDDKVVFCHDDCEPVLVKDEYDKDEKNLFLMLADYWNEYNDVLNSKSLTNIPGLDYGEIERLNVSEDKLKEYYKSYDNDTIKSYHRGYGHSNMSWKLIKNMKKSIDEGKILVIGFSCYHLNKKGEYVTSSGHAVNIYGYIESADGNEILFLTYDNNYSRLDTDEEHNLKVVKDTSDSYYKNTFRMTYPIYNFDTKREEERGHAYKFAVSTGEYDSLTYKSDTMTVKEFYDYYKKAWDDGYKDEYSSVYNGEYVSYWDFN